MSAPKNVGSQSGTDAQNASALTATKPVRRTDAQIKELDLARRSDGKNGDWVKLYLEEFPPEEQRDVEQLRTLLAAGKLALHETREKDGRLITWSMSQDFPADVNGFWMGCWTVTLRSEQSSGIGRVHFARVIETMKSENPNYIGRFTEIEATEGLDETSQPVRRAKFYNGLGLQQIDIDYEIPLFQPADAKDYIPQAQLGKAIKGQLLIATFSDKPITGEQVRSAVRRIYEKGYHIQPTDPYIAQRLALITDDRANYLVPIRILSQKKSSTPVSSTPVQPTALAAEPKSAPEAAATSNGVEHKATVVEPKPVEANAELVAANTKLLEANAELVAANTKLQEANAELVAANARLVEANAKLVAANSQPAVQCEAVTAESAKVATQPEVVAAGPEQVAMQVEVAPNQNPVTEEPKQ